MIHRNFLRNFLIVASALSPVLPATESQLSSPGLSGKWMPVTDHAPVALSIEHPPAPTSASRLTPPERVGNETPGYRVVVEVAFDEGGMPLDTKIHASDDNTPGAMLDQVALQLARNVRQPPRLKDGQSVRFAARIPYFFPVERDEGPESNRAPKPRLLRSQPPQFPDLLARNGESGGAILELIINEHGAVKKARVLGASHEVCGDAAVAAVKNWLFAPAEKHGRSIDSRWRIAVSFDAPGHPAELKWRLAPRPSLGFYTVKLD